MSALNAEQPIQPPSITPGSHAERRALLATCVAAAARAGEIVRAGARKRHAIVWENKSSSDFVSAIDRNAEQAIAEIISQRHPDAMLLAEEFSPSTVCNAGLLFIADPLDGTTNFLHGYPWYAVSIAAAVDGVLAAGAVLNVATGELFTATAGGGARAGGQPIAVSTIEDPTRALIGTGFPFKHGDDNVARYLAALPRLMGTTAGLRRCGSAALDLADVAAGRFEAFFELMLAPWDLAAGILLIREAGGIVTDLDGAPPPLGHTPIVAGNPVMHRWLLEQLTQ